MAKSFEEIDRLAMDIISGSMYSLNFLRNISVAIFDMRIEDMTVREFYTAWLKKAKDTEHSVPYCLGSILGYLYCGLLLSKERWYDLLPLKETGTPLNYSINREKAGMILNGLCHEQQAFMVGDAVQNDQN